LSDVLTRFEQRDERERAEAKRLQFEQEKDRAMVQEAMAQAPVRRMVMRFLNAAGSDLTTLRDTPIAMGHAAGWQDAARWWLAAIREYCPEREQQMRAEAKREAREGAIDEVSNV
jgi:hypothetical protein